MAPAELNEKRVNRPDLHSSPATSVPDLGCFDMVFAIWLEKRKRCQSLQELDPRLGPGKALKEFLKDETCGEHLIGSEERMAQRVYFRCRLFNIATERQ
jgi:hypothetical protein